MGRDPSYAEYVDARWFVLYRLAALLVGEERAGPVTEAALARVYLHWPEVLEAASPDAYVEGLLARTAVDECPTVEGVGDHGLDVLPTRQRAVAVLRCYELLAAAEIARALGGTIVDVEADWAAAVAGSGLTEHELAHEFERRAEATIVPPPPVDRLVAGGRAEQRRERRRRLGWAARIAAAVVVVLAGATLLQHLTGRAEPDRHQALPDALSQLPLGVPPRAAYSDGLTLETPAGPLILRHQPVALVQGGDWLYVTEASGTVEQVDARSLTTTTLTPAAAGQVVTDTSGRRVAWLEAGPSGRPPVVAVRAAGAGTSPVHEQPFPRGAGRLVLAGLTSSGDLVVSRPREDRAWVWHTGVVVAPGRPQVEEISGLGNGGVGQVAGDDLVLGHVLYFAVGHLREGTFFVEDELEARHADFSDPSGRRIVYVDVGGRAFVRQRGRPPRPPDVRLGVPTGLAPRTVRWEDSAHVLLDGSDRSLPDGALVRCDVHTGACELAATFDGPHLLAR